MGCSRQFAPKNCVSLQFRATNITFLAKGFIRQKQNVPRTTAPCVPKFQNVRFALAAYPKFMNLSTVNRPASRAQKYNILLQFWPIDTTFLPRGLPDGKWNLRYITFLDNRTRYLARGFTGSKWNSRFATVLGDRHYVFSEGFTASKWNLRFATVLGDRRRVFSERVDFRLTLPIPPGGIE